MPKENLNLEEDESVIDQLNPKEEESEDEDLEFRDEDFEESEEEPEKSGEDKPDASLDAYNAEMKKRGLNYNFKSWDDVYKTNKSLQDAISKKGMEEKKDETVVTHVVEKKEEVVTAPSNMSERLLRLEQPESVFVLDDIKKEHPNKDVYEVWNSSEYYKREATARSETEKAKTRIANPAGGADGKPEVDETEQKFINSLPTKYKK